jgi:glycine/D-amino acid oxidase-like deaminating enzyme
MWHVDIAYGSVPDHRDPSVAGRPLWADTLPVHERVVNEPLAGDTDVDVAIVGAGMTGLWTALHLLRRDPSLRVVVVDREDVGFGASGRNGGWCSALLPMSLPTIARRHGKAAATRMQAAMHDTVAEVAAFAESAGVADACRRSGTVNLARNPAQVERLHEHLATMAQFGFRDDHRWLDASEASDMVRAHGVLGGAFTPHCATVHPARLTHAVARAAIGAGARVHSRTAATAIEPGRVTTDRGTIRADVVVRATEGYTAALPGAKRDLLPIYSLMIATAPVDAAVWEQIGLDDRPTFNDDRHLVIYGQRTSDDRIAFGGRGAPYHFGSAIKPEYDTHDRVRELLTRSLHELFPALADVPVTHHWGGVLAAPRDWNCSVRFDRSTGLATAGGYVGDGVATTNLAGRTLAASITESDDDEDRELLRLPWVGHRSRRWEPEPLRWIGVNAGRWAASRADAVEERTGHPSRLWGGVVGLFTGH